MSLVANDLKQAMLDATEGSDNANDSLKKLGDSIADYVNNNLEISYIWNGISPVPAVDPTTSASGGLLGFSVDLSLVKRAGGSPPPAGVDLLETSLISSLTVSSYTITDPGFVVTPMPMTASPQLALLDLGSIKNKKDRISAFKAIADGITSWLTSQLPVAPVLGAHGVFTAPPGSGGTPNAFS